MTRKIAVMISKGGSGKTTTTIHLASGLAEKGYKVLVVDTDTQGQVSRFLKVDTFFGLADLGLSFIKNDNAVVFDDAVYKVRENFDVLSGSGKIDKLQKEILTQSFGIEEQLTDILAGHDEKYDYVILDTSPSVGGMHHNVYQYAEEIIIPFRLQYSTLISLGEYYDEYNTFKNFKVNRKKQTLFVSNILPTFYDLRVSETKHSLEYMTEYVKEHFPEANIFDPIPYDSRVSKSVAYGQSVFEYAPKSKAATAYNKFVDAIVSSKIKVVGGNNG